MRAEVRRPRPQEPPDSAARVLIFLHVPKTAGTVLRQVLPSRFRPEQVFTVDDRGPEAHAAYISYVSSGLGPWIPPLAGDPNLSWIEMLHQLPRERFEGLRLLQGHFWFGLHEALATPAAYLTLLRDPVDRVLSLYQHRVAHHGLQMSLAAYVDVARDWEIDNGQTRRMTRWPGSGGRYDPVTPEQYALARHHLDERFTAVGVTERFAESLAAMCLASGWPGVG